MMINTILTSAVSTLLFPFGVPVVPMLAIGSLALESYSWLPPKILFGKNPPPLPSDELKDFSSVFLLFPGYGGPDNNTDRIIQAVQRSDKMYRDSRFVYCYDWKDFRGNLLRAARDSQSIGQLIGRQLAAEERILDLHVVGISVGAFAADGCVKEFSRLRKAESRPSLKKLNQVGGIGGKKSFRSRLTLLDPFTSRGIFGSGYGMRFFGTEADFCEQYMNTDDPVPSTNSPLPLAHVYDVTSSRQRESFVPCPGDSMHSWPAAFFGLNWADKIDPRKNNPFFKPCHTDRPRGKLTKVD